MPLTAEELRDKRASVLDKVRKLIAKADSTTHPSEEEALREKADELMERFSIDLWMVEAASENSAARVPVGRLLSIDWLYGHPFRDEIWHVFSATAYHTRCVVASWKWEAGKIGVVGLEQDIDYFDLVFTHLLAEMGRRLLPHVDKTRDAEWNAWSLRTKHLGWPEIAWELSNAGMLPWPVKKHYDGTIEKLEGNYWKYDNVASYAGLDVAQKWRRAARKLYRDYCRKNGVEPENSKQPATSAKSYAQGWAQEIRSRLRATAEDRLKNYRGTGMEVALRDIRTVVAEAVEGIYPRPKPVRVESDTNAKPARRRPLPKIKEQPFDPEAYRRGANDAKQVDLVGHPHKRVENKPEELEERT
jgi:hypothetical protein